MVKKNNLKQILIISISVMSVLFVALAIFVHYHQVLSTDILLSHDLQAQGDTLARQALIYHTFYDISLLGTPIISTICVLCFSLMFYLYRYYRETIFILLTPIAALINSIIKIIVNRQRPTADFVQVLSLETDKSFPSGHVNFYTVLFGFLFVVLFFTPRIPKSVRWLIQIVSLFLILTISFSRVYLGVHWATDTIGGYLLGLILLGGFCYLYFKKMIGRSA